MGNYNAVGGGKIITPEQKITRKVVIATGGGEPSAPSGGDGKLTSVNITQEAGGITRGVYEYTKGGPEQQSGKQLELSGGSREIPIEAHPMFEELTDTQINEVQEKVDSRSTSAKFDNNKQTKLFGYLSRKVESYLVPNVVARATEYESTMPSTSDLCTKSSPQGINNPRKSFWVMTGINAVEVGDKVQVTREYTAVPDNPITRELYD